MVYVVTSGTVIVGKFKEAREWAIKLNQYAKQHRSAISQEVVQNLNGPILQIHFVSKYESMAAFEKEQEAAANDSESLALVDESSKYFGASAVRTFSKVLD